MPDNIEDILNLCIERKRSGGDPEDVLHLYPQLADEVRPLLELASGLETLPDPKPTGAGIVRLVSGLAEQKSAGRKIQLFSFPVLARAAAVIVCVLLLGWGAGTASSNTVSGDLLYPVKQLGEKIRFFLTVDQQDRVELRIVFSDERLKEAVTKFQRGGGLDKTLLEAMLGEAKAAADGATGLSSDGRELLLAQVAYQSEFQRNTLEQLKGQANTTEGSDLTVYIDRCLDQCAMACHMMDASGDGPHMTPETIICPMCGHPLDHADDKH
jgi:hypothetical protein